MANKQLVNGIRVYSRHSAGCKHVRDASYVNCDCVKWLQYQLEGNQVRETADTRSWTQAKLVAEKKDRELRGEVPVTEPTVKTVEAAVEEWLEFRKKNGLGNDKPERMGRKLTEWCKENRQVYLHQLTSDRVVAFRNSLPYKTKTSSSLKVHWSVMCGFFGWAHGSNLPSGEFRLGSRSSRYFSKWIAHFIAQDTHILRLVSLARAAFFAVSGTPGQWLAKCLS